MPEARVIGAGLAGCEAAFQLAQRGVRVKLHEMKPQKYSPAHKSPDFAELVCSNSLRGDSLTNAVGLLKAEMRLLGSLILECADACRVEAGGALAVDRSAFSARVTKTVQKHPLIEVIAGEVRDVPDDRPLVIATGPLTSDALAASIKTLLGGAEYLSFYDAAAPIFSFESIDMGQAYFGSRYGRGSDYINCPMDKAPYQEFVKELAAAKQAELHGFEDSRVFEGCMPVEVMARRGEDTLRHGPMRPIGLRDPATGKGAYAVVQLRREDVAGTMYNMVGFQTHLTFSEQKRVFSLIPALKNAEFLRYGVMHRNTYIDSPRLLDPFYSLRTRPELFFAGQMTGVEGYVESASSGLVAGLALSARLRGFEPEPLPDFTALGALAGYISRGQTGDFQPMNINFGLIAPIEGLNAGKRERYAAVSARSLEWIKENAPRILR